MKTIRIEDTYDSFDIVVIDGDKEKRFHFDQEDDHKGLVKVFKALGFKAKWEEVC